MLEKMDSKAHWNKNKNKGKKIFFFSFSKWFRFIHNKIFWYFDTFTDDEKVDIFIFAENKIKMAATRKSKRSPTIRIPAGSTNRLDETTFDFLLSLLLIIVYRKVASS
jgi:hypothetical protein